MKRRHVLAFLGSILLGSTAAARRLLAALQGSDASEHVGSTFAAIADLMFPGEGLPGATALGVHDQVLAKPELHGLITKGVDWLDRYAASQGSSDFLSLNEAGRLAAVDAAFASHDDGMQQFVLVLRYHLGSTYYAQPAIKAAFAYTGPPQPDGFADFQERPA
jgi:Gluconate 2-dehydrogenase subunit 3